MGTATSDGQRFRVLRPHAQGGLGAVFVAPSTPSSTARWRSSRSSTDHADDPVSRQRFLLEAEITGGLEHPGIVPVYGLGTYDDGRPFYAMRFIRGDTLKEAIERFHADADCRTIPDDGRWNSQAPPPFPRRLQRDRLCPQPGRPAPGHQAGQHDVGQHGETLVVDWGLAKAGAGRPDVRRRTSGRFVPSSASGSAETLPGSALGTPAYMSPEQAAGDSTALGPQSDVYSLGATLYCLLDGPAPVRGRRPRRRSCGHVAAGRVPTAAAARPVDRPALEAVCLKAMALKPEDRYAIARALAEDVERWMADEPVTACAIRSAGGRGGGRGGIGRRSPLRPWPCWPALVGLAAVAVVQARANGLLQTGQPGDQPGPGGDPKAQAETPAALGIGGIAQAGRGGSEVPAWIRSGSPDPPRDGRQVKVAEVLDQAGDRLDKGFTGSQATRGRCWMLWAGPTAGWASPTEAVGLHTQSPRGARGARWAPTTPTP